jgi:chemosensory pili system protein ChpA (sensor histidine kinase/response regulator)
VRQDARLSAIPVVMITSRTAGRHREHAMALGATAYLGKPFQETELLALLAQLCAKPIEAEEAEA